MISTLIDYSEYGSNPDYKPLTIADLVAVSYAAVLTERRKQANEWAENALYRELHRQGLGETTEF